MSILTALEAAYVYMLQTEHNSLRARNQKVFCLVRDAIAAEVGLDPEVIQNECEALAIVARAEGRQS